ncbi:hypothetical protein [Brevundimonas sp.]|uniref:hypothetical protein n=1 Tax=Brevundimonas sp. TaxID=1871086 RepID=UPI003F71F2C9
MLEVILALQIFGQDAAPVAEVTRGPVMPQFAREVEPHRSLACDQPEVRRHRVQFDVALDRTGRIVAGPTPVNSQDDPAWRAAAESARRALIMAAPFEVPPGYAGGRYRPTFMSDAACDAADEP